VSAGHWSSNRETRGMHWKCIVNSCAMHFNTYLKSSNHAHSLSGYFSANKRTL